MFKRFKKTSSRSIHDCLTAWFDHNERILLPLPAILLILGMLIFPVFYTLYLSLNKWSGGIQPPTFVGFSNYLSIVGESRFWSSLWTMFYFTTGAVGLQLLFGFIAALLFNRKFAGRGIARTLFIFPMVATPAAMSLVWKFMWDPTLGIIGYLMKLLGLPAIPWLANRNLVLPALIIIDTWQWVPFVTLVLLAGLSSLPTEPFEAAKVDGASSLRTFFSITLPLLRPTIMVAIMFRMIDAIKTFDIIMVITQGGPSHASETLNLYAFSESFNYFNFGYGSSLLTVLAIIVLLGSIIFTRLRRNSSY